MLQEICSTVDCVISDYVNSEFQTVYWYILDCLINMQTKEEY